MARKGSGIRQQASGGGKSALAALGRVDAKRSAVFLAFSDPETGAAKKVRIPAACAVVVVRMVKQAAEKEMERGR